MLVYNLFHDAENDEFYAYLEFKRSATLLRRKLGGEWAELAVVGKHSFRPLTTTEPWNAKTLEALQILQNILKSPHHAG